MRVVLVIALLLSFVQLGHTQAHLTMPPANWCIHEGESVWYDRRAAMRDIVRVTIDIACDEGEVVRLRVKTETKCSLAYCSWNFAEHAVVDGGSIDALFLTFTARRTMRIELAGDRINVEVENNYNQAGRESDHMRAILPLVN